MMYIQDHTSTVMKHNYVCSPVAKYYQYYHIHVCISMKLIDKIIHFSFEVSPIILKASLSFIRQNNVDLALH